MIAEHQQYVVTTVRIKALVLKTINVFAITDGEEALATREHARTWHTVLVVALLLSCH